MSEKVKQIEWYLDELDCANCASKVETGIAKIEGILESNVNFMAKTLRIVIAEDQEAEILPKVKQKLSILEPDIHPTLKKSGAQDPYLLSIYARFAQYLMVSGEAMSLIL